MKEAIWQNKKSGNIRTGRWLYYWPSDRFWVCIDGLSKRWVNDELPEYGDWIYIGYL